jgi:hypothetical protein
VVERSLKNEQLCKCKIVFTTVCKKLYEKVGRTGGHDVAGNRFQIRGGGVDNSILWLSLTVKEGGQTVHSIGESC